MSFHNDYPYSRPAIQVDDYSDAPANQRDSIDSRSLANRTPFYASSSSSSTEMNANLADRVSVHPALIYPATANRSSPSVASTATATPIPSRAASPLYIQDDTGSTCSSDTDDENELESRLLPDSHRRSFSLTSAPRWWTSGPSRRRRRDVLEYGTWRWAFKHYILPFIPKTPLTIVRLRLLTLPRVSYALCIVIHIAFIHRFRNFSDPSHHIPLQPRQAAVTMARLLYHTKLLHRTPTHNSWSLRLVPDRSAKWDIHTTIVSSG